MVDEESTRSAAAARPIPLTVDRETTTFVVIKVRTPSAETRETT